MNTKHNITSLLCTLALLGATASSHAAALNWNWNWSATDPTLTMAGTLTTDPASGGTYQITAATLTSYIISGAPTGLTLTALTDFNLGDNLLVSSDPAQMQLDNYGFSFTLSDDSAWNIYALDPTQYAVGNSPHGSLGQFTATLSAVPEPSEWTAISFAVLGLAYAAKRRLTKAAH